MLIKTNVWVKFIKYEVNGLKNLVLVNLTLTNGYFIEYKLFL
jgi:hypothetical protein